MDKKLLSALSNLSVALDKIGEAMASKKEPTSPTAQALKSGKFIEQINQINEGVKELKKDTKKILANQQTILAMSKKGDKKADATEDLGKDKDKQKSLKEGLGAIMMIAVAVLALGMAFKIVGSVNFFSVIAISTAILLLSIAFAKVHVVLKKVGFTPKDGINFILAVVAISIGVAASSWILSTVKPIGLAQFFTTLFIAGAFAIIGHGMNGMIGAFKGKSPKEIAMAALSLPIILPAIAIGIAISSWALQLVVPISLAQFFTTLFIAGAFAVIAYGMNGLLAAFKGKSPKEIALAALSLPIILPAIAIGIAVSSWALQLVKPISLAQFFTTLFIAVAFTVIAYGMNQLIGAFKGKNIGEIVKVSLGLVLVLPAIALAITASSWILSLSKPIPVGDLLKLTLLGVALAAIAVLLTPVLKVLGNISIGTLLKGGLAIVLVAAAIMASSWILSFGKYDKYPDWNWALGVGLSILAFAPAMVILGSIAMSGIGALAILAGGAMVLAVAATVVGASHILALGNYAKGPTLDWASGVGIVMTVFGFAMLTLGTFILATFGLGALAMVAGSAAALLIADTIVKSADIFRTGNFTGGPKKEWSEGVAMAIGAFSPVYGMLMNQGIMKLFGGGGVSPLDFSVAIQTISHGIVTAAGLFNSPGAKVAFAGGPKKEWAEGVGGAIAAFAPVYKVLSESKGFFGGGPSVEEMQAAIITISATIIAVAVFFGKFAGAFDISKVPSKQWGENVGSAINAFAPVFKQMSDDSGIFTSGEKVIKNMSKAIISTAASIAAVSILLAKGDYSKNIPLAWMKNATVALLQFSVLSKMMTDNNKAGGVFGAISSMFGGDPLSRAASGIVKLSIAYTKLANSLGAFSGVINTIDGEKLSSFKSLTGNLALLSLMDAEMFSAMLDKLEEKAGTFSDIVKEFEKQQSSSPGTVVGKKPGGGAVTTEKKSETAVLGEKLDRIAASLADIQTVVGSNGTLKSYMDSLGKESNIGGGGKVDYH